MNTSNTQRILPRILRRCGRLTWKLLPEPAQNTKLLRRVGRWIYRHFTSKTMRFQSHYTQFMRNPSLVGTVAHLAVERAASRPLRMTSIGCSTGAELYSVIAMVRSAAPDARIQAFGIDLASDVVDAARNGVYWPGKSSATNSVFESGRPEVLVHEAPGLLNILYPQADGSLHVRAHLKKDVEWLVSDASDRNLVKRIGRQDVVLANNVLGPMDDGLAARCLQNLMTLVRPGGYLVIDGVEQNLKYRLLASSGFTPILSNAREIWNGDPSKKGWPWVRWGHEPFSTDEGWHILKVTIFRNDADVIAGRHPVLVAEEAVGERYLV
ncbi:CheR family methyltransferase [Rhizobium sp. BG4]|uniref:CheR family methyltransferase n=1 Tax=Rhizobium sp. BG4 TaxID=2613770 RepID=UPI00193CA543|nr:CheR family methyltransferase [Rhizobium sp. BG4]QRM44623.1 chemotaxis protein CheR [Rhizobium sp. BG4]